LVVEAGVSGSAGISQEYIVYEPQITGYGLNTSSVIWDFKSTKEKDVLGNKKLQLIVQTPKGTNVKGRFLLGAAVSSSLSKWVPVPLSKKKDDVVDALYDLSE
jgi:hypothetical protein